jgi:hypothetical protein
MEKNAYIKLYTFHRILFMRIIYEIAIKESVKPKMTVRENTCHCSVKRKI